MRCTWKRLGDHIKDIKLEPNLTCFAWSCMSQQNKGFHLHAVDLGLIRTQGTFLHNPTASPFSGAKPQSLGQPVLPPYWLNLANFCPDLPVGAGCWPGARHKEMKWRALSDGRSRCKNRHFNQTGPFMGASCAQSMGSGSQTAGVQTLALTITCSVSWGKSIYIPVFECYLLYNGSIKVPAYIIYCLLCKNLPQM